jgi:heme exporter protein A
MGNAAAGQHFTGTGLACRRGERLVFGGLDFALAPGDALVLRGPNGSGKSSLLRVMAGLIRPIAGRLDWGGAAIDDDREAHAAKLHFLGHLDAVKPALTVAENLRFWMDLRGGGAGVAAGNEVRRAALDTLGLGALADAPARYLSAGQRRRLALARLIAAPAPLWLLDEPTNALDDAALAAFEAMLARHRAAGGMVAVATHAAIALPGARELRLDRFAVHPALEEVL